MQNCFANFLAASPVQPRAFDINPAIDPWLLFVGAVVAAIAIVYLYSAQQKVAGRAIVNSLMAIRIALVLMVVAMLLGPVRQWVHTFHSNGTLFVLVDQSQSMRQKDPQSSDAELLHWAAALGYLPDDLHPSLAGVWVNRLIGVRDDLDHFRSDSEHLLSDQDNTEPRRALAGHLDQCRTNLTSIATDLSTDSQVKQLAPDAADSLRIAADSIAKNLVSVSADQSGHAGLWLWVRILGAVLALSAIAYLFLLRDRISSPLLLRAVPAICTVLGLVAVCLGGWALFDWPEAAESTSQNAQVQSIVDNAEIPWQSVHETLTKAITQMTQVAGIADKDFLESHGNDPRVRDAFSKVKQLDRADLAYAALTQNSDRGLKSLAAMMGREEVKLVSFGDHTGITTPDKNDLASALHGVLKDPSGQNTDISAALKFASEQAGGDSSAAARVDGRQNVGSEPESPARVLAGRGTRVFTLLLGSRELARDAAVDHVDAPDWVYLEDQVVVSPVIRLDGLLGRDVTIQLLRGNQIVDTRTIKAKTNQEKLQLRLKDRPPGEGLYDYSVVILPVPDEAVTDNNRQSVRIAVKKDRLNILIVEDEPGWEYQFLRNYLARDHRVKLQVVLSSPAHIEDVQAPQGTLASPKREDGKIDAQVLPSTREEWSGFDIVILGDVPPEKLPVEQQANIVSALRDGGIKALLLIAGQRNMPMRYAGTPMADVIPVELSGSKWTPEQLQDQMQHGFVPVQAPEGIDSILGQLSDDFGTNTQIWANMPTWYWHSDHTAARPGASVIWSIQDAPTAGPQADTETKAPPDSTEQYQATRDHALLATMNVGLGRVLYLASPQTWRMRYVQTPGDDSHIEDAHRRFWGQVVRWAVGSDLPAGGKFVKFGTNKHSYFGGEPVVVTARVMKEDFSPMQHAPFKMIASHADGSQAGQTDMVEAPSEGPGIYRGIMTLPTGSFHLSVNGGEPQRLLDSDTSVDARQKTLAIDVQPDATVEDRDVNCDPERMASIAKAGSGIAMDGCYFDVLANHLPVVDHTQTQVAQAGLFSNPNDPRTHIAHWVFFGVFVILITTEWILRKRGGLV